jgi:hypothetical protein
VACVGKRFIIARKRGSSFSIFELDGGKKIAITDAR